jgi:hypothetical protein
LKEGNACNTGWQPSNGQTLSNAAEPSKAVDPPKIFVGGDQIRNRWIENDQAPLATPHQSFAAGNLRDPAELATSPTSQKETRTTLNS